MEMIVIYDDTGHVYYCAGGNLQTPVGLPYIKVTIPENKRLTRVDISGEYPTAVFEDLPKTSIQQEMSEIENQQILSELDIDFRLSMIELGLI